MRDHSQQPKLNFRNTRSRFFHKKSSDSQDRPNSYDKPQMSTGNYWKQKGNESLRKGNIQDAIQFYTKAIELNPSQSIYFSNRSKCHKLKGNLVAALKDAQDACEIDSENIKAHYLCGCILAQMSKFDFSKLQKAENRLKKALRLCHSLKKNQFADQVSIKLYRLRKLKWFINKQKEVQILAEQISLFQKTKINKKTHQQQNNIQRMIDFNRNLIQKMNNSKQIPDYLCCKITLQLMEDPVCTQAGISYEKSALEDHFKTSGMVQPISRKPVQSKPISNVSLKAAVEEFLAKNPWSYQYTFNDSIQNIFF